MLTKLVFSVNNDKKNKINRIKETQKYLQVTLITENIVLGRQKLRNNYQKQKACKKRKYQTELNNQKE